MTDCPNCGYPSKTGSKGIYRPGEPCPSCKHQERPNQRKLELLTLKQHRAVLRQAVKELADYADLVGSVSDPVHQAMMAYVRRVLTETSGE